MKSNLMCKVTRGALYALGLSAAICAAPLYAQDTGGTTTGTSTASSVSDEDVIVLPEWDIVTDQTIYANPYAQAASRISASVKDTPLSIQVINASLLQDVGVQDFTDAFRYSPGVFTRPNTDNFFSADLPIKIRGFSAGRLLRNGFRRYYQQNLDGVERVEVVRGPLGALYGFAEPGGIINYVTKRPEFKLGYQTKVKIQYGADNFYKAWIDQNGIIIPDKAAFRAIASYQNSDSWKQYTNNEKLYFLGGLRIKPFKALEIVMDYEYAKQDVQGLGHQSVLFTNPSYTNLGEYEFWQNRSREEDWARQIIDNDSPRRAKQFAYNINVNTRYPTDYTGKATDSDFIKDNPQLFWSDGVPPYADNRPENEKYRILEDGTRVYNDQHPILHRNSAVGRYDSGSSLDISTLTNTRLYHYGWRTLEWLESLGGYDRLNGRFVDPASNATQAFPYVVYERDSSGKIRTGRNPLTGSTSSTSPLYSIVNPADAFKQEVVGEYPANFTRQDLSKGSDFNNNGPGAWALNESHNATSEIRITPAEWFKFRYSFNYYENWSRATRPFNSETLMDGFSLNAGQGYEAGAFEQVYEGQTLSTTEQPFFSSLSEYNRYWTHQADINMDFEIGDTKHNLFFSAEYRDDEYRSLEGLQSPTYLIERVTTYPAGIWDIRYDEVPDVSKWIIHDQRFQSQSNASEEQGYTAMYKLDAFDLVGVWAGIRHETNKNWAINPDSSIRGSATTVSGTTPTYGITFKPIKPVTLYASYSETFNRPPSGALVNTNPVPTKENLDIYYSGSDDYETFGSNPLGNIEGMGYEGGLKFDLLNGRLIGSAAVFHIEKTGLLGSDFALENSLRSAYDRDYVENDRLSGGDGFITDRLVVDSISTNIGMETTEGFELDLNYTPTDNLQLIASFSYMWTRERSNISRADAVGNASDAPGLGGMQNVFPHPSLFVWDPEWAPIYDTSGTPIKGGYRPKTTAEIEAEKAAGFDHYYHDKGQYIIPETPELGFTFWAKYDFTTGFMKNSRIGLGYRYNSETMPSNDSITERSLINPAMHFVDFLVGRKFKFDSGYELDVYLNVTNVFDKQYQNGAFGLTEPRVFYLTAELTF